MTTLDQVLADGLPSGMIADASGWTAVAVDDFPRESGGGTTRGVRFVAGGVTISLPDVRQPWGDAADAARAVYRLAEQIRTRQPGVLVRSFPALAVELVLGGPAQLPVEEGWRVAVRIVEAVRIVLEDAATAGDVTAARVLPLVHRTRFLLLWAPRRFPSVQFPVTRALGSQEALFPRAEQARVDWALDLVNHEDHPLLLSWRAGVLDAELRRLAFVDVTGPDRHTLLSGPLPAAVPAPAQAAPDDPRFRAWLAREAFLPRFMLLPTWRMLRPTVGRRPLGVFGLLAMILLAPVVAVALRGHPVGVLRGVAAVAGTAYLAIFLLAVGSRETTNLWCLRLPAGAALGMVALISLDDTWAHPDTWTWPVVASVVVLAVAGGYLTLEAQGHGVPGGRILAGRVLAVAGLGLAHAVGVAALVLAAVVPAVTPDLAHKLAGPGAASPAELLMLAASVGLAAGVLLQILWDDRPVTYPLTHLPWRGRAR